jgi:hypothetical protein
LVAHAVAAVATRIRMGRSAEGQRMQQMGIWFGPVSTAPTTIYRVRCGMKAMSFKTFVRQAVNAISGVGKKTNSYNGP